MILLALVCGVGFALLLAKYLRDTRQETLKDSEEVVIAAVDIKAKTKLVREMLRYERYPKKLVADNVVKNLDDAVGRIAQQDINVKEQVRSTSLLAPGQVAIPSLKVPDGMRAVTIGGNQVSLVAGGVRDGDHVDLIATYVDGRTKQEVTKMIIQNVLVLWVNIVETDPNKPNGGGASSSITLCVRPEQTELVKAAERNGTLSVSLRGRSTEIVPSAGVTPKQLGNEPEESVTVETNTDKTPIMIPLPATRPSKGPDVEIKVFRGTEERSTTVNH